MTIYPLSAVRTLALHAQGLASPGLGSAGLDMILNTIRQVGSVQIDTLQMVRRSQYVALWSRLGCYHPADLDHLTYHPAERRLFEGWQHAAAFVPLEDYRFQMPRQRLIRQQPKTGWGRWVEKQSNAELVQRVLERIRLEGGLRASDFGSDGHVRGAWWDWKPAKIALEYLYTVGILMIADRKNFQRVYDLTERVLPDWVDKSEPTLEQRDRYWIEQALRALGASNPLHALDYSFLKRTTGRPIIKSMLESGILLPIRAELADGQVHELVIHSEQLQLLDQAADGALSAQHTTFLSPFDSLFWGLGRDMQLWNFNKHIEAYTPAAKRVWGYFCLPILHRERLVGRFDPKLERKTGTLRLKALYLEDDIQPDEQLVSDVAAAMRDFLKFHDAENLVIERSQPAEFGERLMANL